MAGAWHSAYFQRVKRLPPLRRFLSRRHGWAPGEEEEAEARTAEAQAVLDARLNAAPGN